MDTRSKILNTGQAQRALAGSERRWVAVTGYFDPLLAAQARGLAALRRDADGLIVLLLSPAEPLLPSKARAELVAALGMVDYVVLAEEGDLSDLLDRLPVVKVVREEEADARRTEELAERVRARRRAAVREV